MKSYITQHLTNISKGGSAEIGKLAIQEWSIPLAIPLFGIKLKYVPKICTYSTKAKMQEKQKLWECFLRNISNMEHNCRTIILVFILEGQLSVQDPKLLVEDVLAQ